MIRITFEGAVSEVMAEMVALVAAHGVSPIDVAEPQVETDKPKRAPRKAKTEEPSAEGNPSTGAATATEAAGSTAAQTSAPASAGTPTREEVSKKAVAYGQPNKGGTAALKELLTQFGSPNAKWSEISDDKLPALNARLDELLA